MRSDGESAKSNSERFISAAEKCEHRYFVQKLASWKFKTSHSPIIHRICVYFKFADSGRCVHCSFFPSFSKMKKYRSRLFCIRSRLGRPAVIFRESASLRKRGSFRHDKTGAKQAICYKHVEEKERGNGRSKIAS